MQRFAPCRAVGSLFLAAVSLLAGCDVAGRPETPSAPLLSSVAGPTLLQCPTSESRVARGLLSQAGGAIAVGANRVTVPAAAIDGPTEIEVAVPASSHVVVDLRANGQEHWQFLAPLTVTIDYSHCPPGKVGTDLSVWHIDPTTGALLQNMGGVDDRASKTITFTTDHFSGYAIAN